MAMKRSCKGSSCIGYLEQKIDEIDFNKDTSRNGRFNRAILKINNYGPEDIQQRAKELKRFKAKIPDGISFPTALQVTIDENLEDMLEKVEYNVKKALDLNTLQTRYEMEFFNFSLLSELQKDVMLVGETEETVETEDFTGPEMVKRLVEILMLNREQDKDVIRKVKSALLEWEV